MKSPYDKKIVSEFYHDIQFPGHYTQKEVDEKSQDFFLKNFLDISLLPYKAKILEAGCGSGYTTHVIANLRRDIHILGTDFSNGSLEFARNFSHDNNYKNTEFQFMDLRQFNLPKESFDMVICSGVLHHIKNPKPIFSNLCNLVKKNGLILIGLYHPYGRFSVHTRQKLFKITGGRFKSIDPRIRNENWTEHRKNAWFRDQYQHPFEEDYSHTTLLKWFKEENISLLDSLPKYSGSNISYNLYMWTKMGSQGGVFIFGGKKII